MPIRTAQTCGILALGVLLSACSKDTPKPDPAKETAGSAQAATSAAPAPSATQSAAAQPTAAPSAAPTVAAAAKPPASPEPELKEWDSTKLDLNVIKNWNGPGCMARRVREWIRVGCSSTTTQKGAPISIQVLKGFPSTKYSIMDERGGTTMLIFPATEGLDGEATFTFSGGSFRFTASWPSGQPEPKAIGAFEEIALPVEPTGGSADDGAGDIGGEAPEAPVAPAPTKLEKAIVTSDPLPEVPTVEGAPTAEQWTAAKEVGVKGSDGHGCETKQIGEWFRVVCRSNNNTGKVTAATAVRGFDATQGYLVVGNGAVVLLTKYIKGSDIAIDITWEKTVGRVNLKWPETATIPPAIRGEVVSRL